MPHTAYAQALIVREPFEADLPTATLEVSAPFPTDRDPQRQSFTLWLCGEDGDVSFTDEDLYELQQAVASALRAYESARARKVAA